jgi:hypothetical protein
MKYQLFKEHPTSFEIKHPDGSTFHVAKSGLTPSVSKKIMSISKFADGGEVEEQDSSPEQSNQEELSQPSQDLSSMQDSSAQQMPLDISPVISQDQGVMPQAQQMVEPQAPMERKPAVFAPKQPQQQAPQQGGMLQEYNKNIAQEQQGIRGMAQSQAKIAEEQTHVYEQQVKQMQDLQNHYQAKYAEIDGENKQLSQDVMNAKIDPNRIWGNTSTGGKVMAAIGVALSGIGSGLTGKPNMAMQVINDAITRDIDAQKSELGKKENLLSFNLRKYGDLNAATQATSLQLNSIAQGQIAAAASRNGSQQAMSNAQVMIGKLSNDALQQRSGLAINQMAMNAMGGAGSAGIDGANRQILEMTPQFKGRTVALPNGKVGIADTPEDAKKVKEVQTAADDLRSTVNRMKQFKEQNGRTLDFGIAETANNARARAIQNEAIAKVNHLAGLTRLSEQDIKIILNQIPNPGAWNTGKVDALIDELENNVNGHVNAFYQNHLMNYNPGSFQQKERAPGAVK